MKSHFSIDLLFLLIAVSIFIIGLPMIIGQTNMLAANCVISGMFQWELPFCLLLTSIEVIVWTFVALIIVTVPCWAPGGTVEQN